MIPLGLEQDISKGEVMICLSQKLTRTQLINFVAFVTWIEGFLVHLLAIGSDVQGSSDILDF